MKHILSLTLVATALLVAGCRPDEFIWWSPNGETAAVRTSEGLRLASPKGELSAVVLPGDIQSAAWLHDNSGVLVSRSLEMKDWAAIEKLIPAEEAAATRQLARAMPDLLKAGLTSTAGSWDKLEEQFLKPLGLAENPLLPPAMFCALSLQREQILAVLDSFTNSATLKAELHSFETNGLPLYEITTLPIRNGQPAGEPRALVRSLQPLYDPVLSPHHQIVAFRTGEKALKAITLDGKNAVVVAPEGVARATWAADGRALIFAEMGKDDMVGEIRSRIVVGENGELLLGAAQAESLAMAFFAPNVPHRLSVLPDGRILFAALPITLPARVASIASGVQFFLLDPAKPDAAPVPVAIKEGSLPDDLSAFALSPDGRFVAVVESGTDVVAVLELATGKVTIISPPHAGWKSRMIPAWRNSRELTFAAPPAVNAPRPELFLWQPDAPTRVLSKDWPESVVRPWLEGPGRSEEQPGREQR